MTLDIPEIESTPLADALKDRYLSYALSTIMARSLPDVRDGLKPVHRRILFAMRLLGLDPRAGYKKAARVVGDVIGKYHPHGDTAVYEAMVRLAQDFAVRYPLVDGQGNFGNIDGDNAAAMRYTEARLTIVAEALMSELDEDSVDFRTTYDGEQEEPTVFPAAFPNLLANGATGIAVGMATSIPPHNVAEICGALRLLLKNPETPTSALIEAMPGPDFPTGGVLVEPRETIAQAYETGRGSFRLRARWEVERQKNGLYTVIVTEMPYQVPKSRLIERIAELLNDKKLPLLADIRDESTEAVRIVLEPKSRNIDPVVLMESLFRATDLETRVPLNMNVLDATGVPRVMSLRQVLRAFLDHRHEVLQRVSRFRLAAILRRLEVLQGFLIAYLNLDEVIRIIREEDEPKPIMIARFGINDTQAEAILNMRLRSLRRLEEIELRREADKLTAESQDLETLLGDEARRWKAIDGQIVGLLKTFGPKTELGARRTTLKGAPAPVSVEIDLMIDREPLTVLLSEKGWVRALKGHDLDLGAVKHKDGDGPHIAITCQTTDKILVVANDGKFFTLAADRLPRGRGFGDPLRLMIDLGNDQAVAALLVHRPGGKLLVAAKDGRGFLVEEEDALAQTKAGKQILTTTPEAPLAVCLPVTAEHVAVIGDNRKLLIFPASELPVMGRGKGVMLQRYKDGGLSDARFMTLAEGLSWPFGQRTRTVTDLAPWLGARGGSGRLAPVGFPRDNRFSTTG